MHEDKFLKGVEIVSIVCAYHKLLVKYLINDSHELYVYSLNQPEPTLLKVVKMPYSGTIENVWYEFDHP